MIFKNSVRTSKRTPHFTITKISWLILFKEIISVYSESNTKPTNTKYSVTDCCDSWDIYLPLDFTGIIILSVFSCGMKPILSPLSTPFHLLYS
jgi:hypothetical protein